MKTERFKVKIMIKHFYYLRSHYLLVVFEIENFVLVRTQKRL